MPPLPPVSSEEVQNSRRSEEHTSELQSQSNLVCRLLLEKKKNNHRTWHLAEELPGYRVLSLRGMSAPSVILQDPQASRPVRPPTSSNQPVCVFLTIALPT